MLSVVVPVFNEEESLSAFYKELILQVSKLKVDFEVIFVDDGSTDGSLSILKKLEEENKNIRIFSFRKHRGKAEALTLGFTKAIGEYILTIDSDLQDRPDQIEKLIKKSKDGWDLVSGWRKNRKDSFAKNISSKIFNLVSSSFWGLKVNDLNCGLKLYRAEAAKSLNLYGGTHRFIPLILHQEGFLVAEVPVVHDKRKLGKSKYGFSKVFTEIPDMFTMLFLSRYSRRPLHFFAPVGGFIFIVGTIILAYLTLLRLEGYSIGKRPLLFLGMLLVISGLQVFFTGFLADLILHSSSKEKEDKATLKYSSD
ncbi:MAG: glycosyltransferase family 2 protein [Patescibacteria group bacterium]